MNDAPRRDSKALEGFYADETFAGSSPFPTPWGSSFKDLNGPVYTLMQGLFGIGMAGRSATWDRKADCPGLPVPTLTIASVHQTTDPADMRWMAWSRCKGDRFYRPNGSHLSLWDDQAHAGFRGVIGFLKAVDEGRFAKGMTFFSTRPTRERLDQRLRREHPTLSWARSRPPSKKARSPSTAPRRVIERWRWRWA